MTSTVFWDGDDYNCPSCRGDYTVLIKGKEMLSFRHAPCLLECDHTVCLKCIQNALRKDGILCKVCKTTSTNYHLNKYVAGQVMARGFSEDEIPKQSSKIISLKVALPVSTSSEKCCSKCQNRSVSFKCKPCGLFCKRCMDLHHKGNAGHVIISLNGPNINAQTCQEHDKVKEFFCKTDDLIICSCCIIYGHRNHDVIELKNLNGSDCNVLSKSISVVNETKQAMEQSDKNLVSAYNALKRVANKGISQLKAEFRQRHAELQLREETVLSKYKNEVEDVANCISGKTSSLRVQLESIKKLAVAGRTVLNGSSAEPHLIEPLLTIDDIDCYVEPLKIENLSEATISQCIDGPFSDLELPFLKIKGEIVLKRLSEIPAEARSKFICSDSRSETVTLPAVGKLSKKAPEGIPTAFSNSRQRATDSRKLSLDPTRSMGVKVVHIVDPDEFYAVGHKNVESFEVLSNQLNEFMTKLQSTEDVEKDEISQLLEDVKIDHLYVFLSAEHGTVRCRVIDKLPCTEAECKDLSLEAGSTSNDPNVSHKTLIKCFLLDFGTVELVETNKLYTLPNEFSKVPELAIKCSLHYIQPRHKDIGWSSAAISVFKDYVLNRCCVMTIYESNAGVLSVDLHSDMNTPESSKTPASVRDSLVFMEFAQFACPPSTLIPVLKYYSFPPLRKHVSIKVTVSFCVNPQEFYVQESKYLTEFHRMLNAINPTRKRITLPLEHPQEGMPCLAKYEGEWYRAEIVSLEGDDMINVYYVDYGNEGKINCKDVEYITSEQLKIPKMAYKCRLTDVEPLNGVWTREAIEAFANKVVGIEDVQLIVKDIKCGVHYVSLSLPNDKNMSLNARLVNENHCISTGPTSVEYQSVESSSSLFMDNFYDPRTESDFPEDIALLEKLTEENRVLISEAESPYVIYVQWMKDKIAYRKFQRELLDHGKKQAAGFNSNLVWNESDICIYEKDSVWLRGSIVKIEDEVVSIRNIDIGSLGSTNIHSLFWPTSEMSTKSAFATLCHLDGITPAGGTEQWSNLAKTCLQELKKQKEIYLLRLTEEDEESLTVDFIAKTLNTPGALDPITYDYISFTDSLIDKGAALGKKFRKRTLSSKETLNKQKIADKTAEENVFEDLHLDMF